MNERTAAALGSSLFFALAPGVVAGVQGADDRGRGRLEPAGPEGDEDQPDRDTKGLQRVGWFLAIAVACVVTIAAVSTLNERGKLSDFDNGRPVAANTAV